MANYLNFGEGFLAACGVLMAVVGALLWRHHPMRPQWGLRWLALAMGCGAVINLMAPLLITHVWREGARSALAGGAQLAAMMVGFGSLAAMVVGTRHYMLRPPTQPVRLFLGVWIASQVTVVVGAGVLRVPFLGDLLTAGIFCYCAWLAFSAVRQEPSVGHGLVGLAFAAQPLTLLALAAAGRELQTSRFMAAAPYAAVGLVYLSSTLIRLRNELATELHARTQAETQAQRSALALRQSHAVQQALLQQAPVPTAHSPVVAGQLSQTYWNQAWYSTFGHAPGSKEGMSGADFDFYADPGTRERFMDTVLTQGHAGPFEARLRTATGSIRMTQMYASLIDSDEGKFVVTSFFDITEQRRSELHLREFEAMVHSADDVMLLFSNQQITFANAAAERMFGIAAHAMVGRGVVDISPPQQADGRGSLEAALSYVRLALEGTPQRFYWLHQRADGTVFTAQVALTAMESAPDQLVAVVRDVTEQKRAELELHKARQMAETIARAQLQFIVQKDRHQSFNELLNDILALADSEYGFIGEVLYTPQGQPYLKTYAITNIAWNDATQAFYAAHAPKGMEFTKLDSLFGAVLRTGQSVIANDPAHDPRRGGLPQGHPALNAFLGVPVYNGQEMVGMFGISNRPGGYDQQVIDYLRPLTATIGQLVSATRSQIKQQETELRLNSISNNLPNSMVYQLDCGEDGTARQFSYLSAGIEALHGLARSDVLRDAALLYAQIHPDDLPQLAAQEAACLQAMTEFNTEYRGRGPDGGKRWFYLSSTPSRNANNHVVWDGIEVDITARKSAEHQLAELNQTLESRVSERTWELTQALNELHHTQQDLIQSEKLAALGALVAGVAHELNTPIGNAVTVSSTLVDAHADLRDKMGHGLTRAALNDFLDTVGEAGAMLNRNLVRAADLVSSFKQVAVDQNNHQRRPFALEEILSEVQIIMAPGLRKAHVRLQVDLRDKLALDSFPGALTQVLMILITNAITHAFEGRDGGEVRITAEAAGPARVHITVADDGVGIPAVHLGRIFEPFYTTKLGKGGSGLGLHICYNVVTSTLGGKVSVDSTPGQGTRMRIDLPLSAPQTSTTAPAP